MLTQKFSLVEHHIPPSPREVKAFIASEAMPCPQILGMNTKIKNKKQPMNSNNNNGKKKKHTQRKHRNGLCLQISIVRVTSETTVLKSQGFWWTKELGLFDLMFHREDIFYIPELWLWLWRVRVGRDWILKVSANNRDWGEGRWWMV